MHFLMEQEADRILEVNKMEKLPDCFLVRQFKADAEKILKKLLSGEFQEIRKTIHLIIAGRFTSALKAMVYKNFFNSQNSLIFFNLYRFSYNNPEKYKGELERILRHELLHILTNAADDDWQFKDEALRRGIWASSLSEEIARKERAK